MIRTFALAIILTSAITGASQTPVFETVFGDSILEKPLSIHQLGSGSIYLSGFAQSDSIGGVDFSLSKLTSNGVPVWTRYLGTALDDYLGYSDLTIDSSFFIMAGSTDSGSGDTDGLIIKSDSAGNEVWSTSTGFPVSNDVFNSVQVTADSGFVVCGFTAGQTGIGLDYYVVKYDFNGTMEWQKVYGGTDNDYAQSIRQTADGGYILVGDSKSFNSSGNYDIWLLKLDASGDSTWSAVLGDVNHINGSQDVIILSDGSYLIAGETTVPPATGFEFTLVNVNTSGNVQWFQLFGGTGSDALFSPYETSWGDIIITGYSNTNSAGNSPLDLVVVATDPGGNEIGRQYFGGNSIDIGYDLQPAQNGNFLICGMYHGFDDDYYALELEWSDIVGMKELQSSTRLNAYPNPAVEELIISNADLNEPVYILDMTGKVVKRITISSNLHTIDLNELGNGIYLIRNGSQCIKFVVSD